MSQKFHARDQTLLGHPLYEKLEEILAGSYESLTDIYLGMGYKASGRWAQARGQARSKSRAQPEPQPEPQSEAQSEAQSEVPPEVQAEDQAEPEKQRGYFLIEDAFVRSIFPGYTRHPIYGIIADSTGMYYGYQGNSDLIHVLNGSPPPPHWAPPVEQAELTETLALFRQIGASKYNCFSPSSAEELSGYKKGVLIADQTKGDAAIKYGGIKESDFDRMLNDAIEENPDLPIYIRAHPDHDHLSKNSCFREKSLSHPRVQILPASITPQECFQFCETIYVGTSLLGMEALIHGKKVLSYGWPFYAGWGLTEDRSSFHKPPRDKKLSIEELFATSYMRYCLYFHPETRQACSLKTILLHLQTQKRSLANLTGKLTTFQCTPWARQVIAKYLKPKSITISNASKAKHLTDDLTVLTWGANEVEFKGKVIRVEDGFIRSRRLGANFDFPLSMVYDDVGIYFDARTPSRLENLLQQGQFTPADLSQAEELINFLREHKLTKYNLGIDTASLPTGSEGKKVILVPGQVDSDASVKYGSPKLENNKELLDEVRRQHPDAYICYKPHPDLVSRARADKPLWPGIEQQVDHLVTEGDIISWIEAVDEVHTLTSTVGFEALIRNKPVFTYGMPFYAGWGLTHDWLSCERRTATRTLEELVYATLIRYPVYFNPQTVEYTTALNVAKLLADPGFTHDARPGSIKMLGILKRLYNKFLKKS